MKLFEELGRACKSASTRFTEWAHMHALSVAVAVSTGHWLGWWLTGTSFLIVLVEANSIAWHFRNNRRLVAEAERERLRMDPAEQERITQLRIEAAKHPAHWSVVDE